MKTSVLLLSVLALWASLVSQTLYGQTFTERVLWSDTTGSLEIEKNASNFSFDREGNFCFDLSKDKGSEVVTNKELPYELSYCGGGYRVSANFEFLCLNTRKTTDFGYVKNKYSPDIYRIAGKGQGYRSGNTKQHLAVTSVLGDSVFFYLDGRLVYSCPNNTLGQFRPSDEAWADFSENGNVIYYLEQDKGFVLYVNGQPVDTSDYRFAELSINDNGDYLYAAGYRPEHPVGKYDYMFYIHTKDTVFDYVRTVWKSALTNNGAYYFSGDDCGPDYILLNGRLRKGIENVRNITLVDSQNAFYSFEKDNRLYLNVNGVDYSVDFEEIYNPTMDAHGHFAYYGLKDYFLYKVVDGKASDEPLSKYGVRAQPLHLTTSGYSLHYFKTDDSVFVYHDNDLIFNPINKEKSFNVFPWRELNLYHSVVPAWPETGHSLLCLNYGEQGYFVYDGQLSEALLPIHEKYFGVLTSGAIVEGVFNEHGYFAIQYTGEKTYKVIVNNQIYKELKEVDKIFPVNGFFDGKQVIFYGMKNHSICQFVITL